MDAATLSEYVSKHAAIRRRQRLQPVGGKGDKIFPPTYPGDGRNNPPPRHVFERRRLDGREVWCVLVDSVQSQANRLEESLLAVSRDKSSCPPPKFHPGAKWTCVSDTRTVSQKIFGWVDVDH